MEAFLAALLSIPPQCDYEPTRPYTIEYVSPKSCGYGSLACTDFGVISLPRRKGAKKRRRQSQAIQCFIRVSPTAPYLDAHIRHEKAHCNCPSWNH